MAFDRTNTIEPKEAFEALERIRLVVEGSLWTEMVSGPSADQERRRQEISKALDTLQGAVARMILSMEYKPGGSQWTASGGR